MPLASDTDILFLYNYMPSLWVVKNDWGWFILRDTRRAHLPILYLSSIALKMCFSTKINSPNNFQ